MKSFMDDDFLLDNPVALRLYHDLAKTLPIIDFHSHLDAGLIARDEGFDDLARAWLAGDHYKWRLMRAAGFPEAEVTGPDNWDRRYRAWAATMEQAAGNPVYHWTHLELRRYFGITQILDRRSADSIRQAANEQLAGPAMGVRGLLARMQVSLVATTDDPADSLEWHRQIRQEAGAGRIAGAPAAGGQPGCGLACPVVVPTFRPDRAAAGADPAAWNAWRRQLEQASGQAVDSWASLVQALDRRHAAFHDLGCRLSDHGLEYPPRPASGPESPEATVRELLAGRSPGPAALEGLAAAVLREVARLNLARGWTMQLHLGPIRGLSGRLARRLGPDVGGDAMGDRPSLRDLASLLDWLDADGALCRTILYTINPALNDGFAVLAGSFQDGSLAGRVQFGAAWWFNDHKTGIRSQLETAAAHGLLARFPGMVTDSRSFLSFPRHEYFRRIFCNLLGSWVQAGELPPDQELLERLVLDACHDNAARMTGLPQWSRP